MESGHTPDGERRRLSGMNPQIGFINGPPKKKKPPGDKVAVKPPVDLGTIGEVIRIGSRRDIGLVGC